MNKNHTRGTDAEMRRQISLKSEAYPEGGGVDVARMSGEDVRITRGDLPCCLRELPLPRGGGKVREKSAEGIVTRACEGAMKARRCK